MTDPERPEDKPPEESREATRETDSETPSDPHPERTVAWNPEDLAEITASRAVDRASDSTESTSGSSDDPLVGTLIRDKWRVLERLGAGSFGTVYKVRDEKGGWIEALKILAVDRLQGAEAANARERFLREARIMKRLGAESPHIVGLSTYEEDLEAGLVYFLMEFVEGRSLAEALREEGPFSMERTLRIGLQICDALVVAHEGPDGVVHRDLKLENVMLTRDRSGEEIAKILDFGIAKIAERDADSRLTTVGTLGTPGYAAPEQLRAEPVDARTDLFAVGVIFYALLSGRDPWLGHPAHEPTTQIYELMAASDRAEIRPLEETGVEVPPAMANVVKRLLRRNPDARFASASELKTVLKRVAAGGEASDVGSLRVITDPPGVRVEVRSGRQSIVEGPTPCVANGLEPGTYRIQVVDSRYEPVETSAHLEPGAIEDLQLLVEERSTGLTASVRRHPLRVAMAALVLFVGAGAALARPWGATLEPDEVRALAREGSVADVRVSEAGVAGRATDGWIPMFFEASLPEEEVPALVEDLRAAGVSVDTSAEVGRLIDRARRAQAEVRYFGPGDDDVRDLAQRAVALDPDNPEARSLLLKVAERMAWDAQAALADGSPDAARSLIRECLEIVPEHPGCITARQAL